MQKCKDCGYSIEKCLDLPQGKKCCPDCKCYLINKGIRELDEFNAQLNSMSDDEKMPSEYY